jgi:hypothetical protein
VSYDEFPGLWIPAAADELESAIAGQSIREDHFHDAKRELGRTPQANKNLAIDLASFAVDGGLVLIGVEEHDLTFAPHLIELDGLRERVDQIAGSLIDPPLRVETRALRSDDDPARGYLVVVIPPSPDAPHAVEGIYRARGDSGNRRVPDIEFRRIRADRATDEVSIGELLASQMARDPMPARKHAHLYCVANPVPGRKRLILPLLTASPPEAIVKLVRDTPEIANSECAWSPDFLRISQAQPRADGWSVSSYRLGPGRIISPDQPEERLLEVEVGEGGCLHLVCGRASAPIASWTVAGNEPPQFIFERLITGLTWRLVHLAGNLSARTSYLGNWQFAIGVLGIRGLRSFEMARVQNWEFAEPYSADDYREATVATAIEAQSDPNAVTHRLVDRLNRSVLGDVDAAFPRFVL